MARTTVKHQRTCAGSTSRSCTRTSQTHRHTTVASIGRIVRNSSVQRTGRSASAIVLHVKAPETSQTVGLSSTSGTRSNTANTLNRIDRCSRVHSSHTTAHTNLSTAANIQIGISRIGHTFRTKGSHSQTSIAVIITQLASQSTTTVTIISSSRTNSIAIRFSTVKIYRRSYCLVSVARKTSRCVRRRTSLARTSAGQ